MTVFVGPSKLYNIYKMLRSNPFSEMGAYNAKLRVDNVKLGSSEIEELMPYMDVAKHHVSYQQMFTIYHFSFFLKAMADCPSSIQLLCDHGASVNAKDVVSPCMFIVTSTHVF